MKLFNKSNKKNNETHRLPKTPPGRSSRPH